MEGDLDDFSVARGARAHVFVRRVRDVSARVSRLNFFDSLQVLEGGFEAPEAPAGEGRDFGFGHGGKLTQSFDSGATRRNIFKKAYGESGCGMRDVGWVVWGLIPLPASRIPSSLRPCTS